MAYDNNNYGNNNNNKNKNNKKPANYFINGINKIGENFLDYKNSKDIYYDVPTIFRQLGRKQIELDKYGHFFFDIPFLDGCISACNERSNFAGISYNAMYMMASQYTNAGQQVPPNIASVMDAHQNTWRVYQTISYYLQLMRNTG